MKTSKKEITWFSLSKAFRSNIVTEARVSLNSIELLALFRRIGWRVLSACTSKKVKFSSRLKQLNGFAMHILRMTRHHGVAYSVNYLKASQLAVQKRLGNQGVKSLRDINPDYPFPRLTSSRLPSVIPLGDRRAILSGNVFVIRWWLTLFSLYRIVRMPGKMKLNTITDPFSGNLKSLERVSMDLALLVRGYREMFPKALKPSKGFKLFETASPIHSVSWHGWFATPTILDRLGMSHHIKVLCGQTNIALWEQYSFWLYVFKEYVAELWGIGYCPKDNFHGNIGQLAAKEEAAGKVRIFALVDCWTQNVLKPLHEYLFDFLKNLPNDGTFDQHASVRRSMDKVKVSGQSFGYDLSAATDRLPIALQVSVLEVLFGKDFALAWKSLLVDREYVLDNEKYGSETLRYSVGQPMGALSSWAMLAVTHHFLVQLAYWRAHGWTGLAINGKLILKYGEGARGGQILNRDRWYTGYELLGDDIVIFDRDVAHAYLDIMSELGVGINLAKSVVASNRTTEFAKVTSHNGENVSAISWQMFISQNTMMGRVNIAFSLLAKGIVSQSVMRWYRLLVRQGKFKKGNYNISLVALFTMFANQGLVSMADLLKSLYDEENPFRKFYKSLLLNLKTSYVERLVTDLIRKEVPTFSKKEIREKIWDVEQVWVRLALWRPLQSFWDKVGREDHAGLLAKEIIQALIPGLLEEQHFTLTPQVGWSRQDFDKQTIYMTVYMECKKHMDGLVSNFSTWDRKAMDNLPYLVSLTDDMDRYREFREIVQRGQWKLDGNKKGIEVGDKVRSSPLKILSFILKTRQRRPKWTKRIY